MGVFRKTGFWLVTALLFALSVATQAASVAPEVQWTKTFGGSSTDIGYSVANTSDGGYIIIGETFVGERYKAYLIKTDASGNMTWSKTFNEGYRGNSVLQTSDGGYVIAGFTYINIDRQTGWLIKTDADGNKIWDTTFTSIRSNVLNSVSQTSDGGYIVVGRDPSSANGNVLLIKTNVLGSPTWSKSFGGTSDDEGYSVAKTSDGGYIVTGFTRSFGGGFDVYLIKTDAYGNKIWDKPFGGSNNDVGNSVVEAIAGGYVVAGTTLSYGAGFHDVWLIKTDADGNKIWDKTFGGLTSDFGKSVRQTSDDGYIIAGDTQAYGDLNLNALLIKTDAEGNKIWDKAISGLGVEHGNSVVEALGGGFVLVGSTQQGDDDVWLVKLAPTTTNLIAETSLAQAKDSNGAVVMKVKIDRIKNPADNSTANVPGGIGSYSATVNGRPDNAIRFLRVNGVSPFDNPTFDNVTGIFSVATVSLPPQASNTTVAHMVPILTGNITTLLSLTIAFQAIAAAGDPGLNVPEERSNTITMLRGDVDNSAVINITDALALEQYLVGHLLLSQINPLNAASVNHDGTGGDKITVADALAIKQFLVGQLNVYFQ